LRNWTAEHSTQGEQRRSGSAKRIVHFT